MGACATLATTSWGKVSCVCYQPTIFGSLKILFIHRNFHQHWLDDGPVNKLHTVGKPFSFLPIVEAGMLSNGSLWIPDSETNRVAGLNLSQSTSRGW